MTPIEKENIQTEIAHIIERSRHSDEMFLTDSKSAALQIMSFLQRENILPLPVLGDGSVSNN